MKRKNSKVIVFILLLLVCISTASALTNEQSPNMQDGQIGMDPKAATVVSAESFDVTVIGSSSEQIDDVYVELIYDTNKLQLDGANPIVVNLPTSWQSKRINTDTAGKIIIEYSAFFDVTRVTGTFDIATLSFKLKPAATGLTTISINPDTDRLLVAGVNSVSYSPTVATMTITAEDECDNACTDGSRGCNDDDDNGWRCELLDDDCYYQIPFACDVGTTCSGGTCVGCGNGVVDAGEQCDGTNLNGITCISDTEYAGGILRCTSDCEFDASDCCKHTCEIGDKICDTQTSYSTCILGGNGCRSYSDAISCGTTACSNGQCESNSIDYDGWVMFVSKDPHDGDFSSGSLTGIEGANKICQDDADASDSIVNGKYIALLSMGGSNSAEYYNIIDALEDTGKFVNVQNQVIALSSAELFDDDDVIATNDLSGAVRYQANGEQAIGSSFVWTGTKKDGTFDSPDDCNDWSSSAGSGVFGTIGQQYIFYGDDGDPATSDYGYYRNYYWIYKQQGICANSYLLYCVQVADSDAPTCLEDQTDCSGTCTDILNDLNNCGGCGISCGDHATCAASYCVCDSDYTMNGGVCTLPGVSSCTEQEDCADDEYCLINNICVPRGETSVANYLPGDTDCSGTVTTTDVGILFNILNASGTDYNQKRSAFYTAFSIPDPCA